MARAVHGRCVSASAACWAAEVFCEGKAWQVHNMVRRGPTMYFSLVQWLVFQLDCRSRSVPPGLLHETRCNHHLLTSMQHVTYNSWIPGSAVSCLGEGASISAAELLDESHSSHSSLLENTTGDLHQLDPGQCGVLLGRWRLNPRRRRPHALLQERGRGPRRLLHCRQAGLRRHAPRPGALSVRFVLTKSLLFPDLKKVQTDVAGP